MIKKTILLLCTIIIPATALGMQEEKRMLAQSAEPTQSDVSERWREAYYASWNLNHATSQSSVENRSSELKAERSAVIALGTNDPLADRKITRQIRMAEATLRRTSDPKKRALLKDSIAWLTKLNEVQNARNKK
jgi:hypothetical protein